MTDTNQKYRRLAKVLNGTRKTLAQVCHDLDIDMDTVRDDLLQNTIDQCSHCNIWSDKLVEDLDGMPICRLCERLVGR
jgi:hypothetical protein